MSSYGKIDYRNGIDILMSNISDMEIEDNGIHLLTKLLNIVNNSIISNIKKEFNSIRQISDKTLVYCGTKAFGLVLDRTLRKRAMAEALRQLALLEIECFREDSIRNKQLRLVIEKEIRDEELREDEKLTNHFISRVKNLSNKILDDFLIDSDGNSLLSHRLHDFMRIVAKNADDMFFEKDELQPDDIRIIVEKYLGKDTFKDANRKGNTYLNLFENGLLEFKPSPKFASCINNEDAEDKRNKMMTIRFISGVKNFSNEILDGFWPDLAVRSFLGQRLHDFMKKVAITADDTFVNKDVLQPEDIRNILAKFLSKDTFNAANSEGNKYLLLFEKGMLKIKLKLKFARLSNDDVLEEKIPVKDLEPSCKKVLPYDFPISLSDETVSIYLDQVLQDIAQFLAQNAAEMCQRKNTYEIRSEDIFQAVADSFPEQLKQNALLKSSNDITNFANGVIISGISEKSEMIVSKRVLRSIYKVFNNVIGTLVSTGLKTADHIAALGSEVMEASLSIY